jgi:hypothetical protein
MKKLIAGGLVMGALLNAQAHFCCGFCPAAFGIAAVGTGIALGAAVCAANQCYYSGGYYYAAPPAYYAAPPAPVVVQQPTPVAQDPAPQAPAPAAPAKPASPMAAANNLFGR